ncbi:hypothetical protein [Cellulomonas sp. KH9]|uniref:hypothetical protein n=1 Tax=Cellulomonas sp. KH9 TaxID=1855324 RepID=UPI0008E45E76|nr:hypothetical protein [Cellulomonas sp. KH9]SFK13452.1 hypothetical protein SAMN05216467_2113 [Cellulomonas sp. KH9]
MTTPARLRRPRTTHPPLPRAAAPLAPAPTGPRAGFVLYVSLPQDGADTGTTPRPGAAEIAETADLLRELAQEALPGADTFAALSLVPGTAGDVRSLGERITHLRLLEPVPDTDPGTPDVLTGSGDAG